MEYDIVAEVLARHGSCRSGVSIVVGVNGVDGCKDLVQCGEGKKTFSTGDCVAEAGPCVITGRPAARYVALRSLNQPLRNRTF